MQQQHENSQRVAVRIRFKYMESTDKMVPGMFEHDKGFIISQRVENMRNLSKDFMFIMSDDGKF